MKKILMAFFFILCTTVGFAQSGMSTTEIEIMKSNYTEGKVLVVLNSKLVSTEELKEDSLYLVENGLVIFGEGDSSWIKCYYGSTNKDNSIITQYYGKYRDNGINFIYTKDKVQRISTKEYKKMTKAKNSKYLFYTDNLPISNKTINIFNKNIKDIFIIPNFKLMKWDTGKEDVYTLFYVSFGRRKRR